MVTLSTDRTERLSRGSALEADGRWLEVVASRRHQHRWIVSFAGIGDRAAAEGLRGKRLRAPAVEGTDPGDLWVHELVGAEVVTPDGRRHGRVEAVQANPAADLLVLDAGQLVPVTFVVDADQLPDRVVVDPPAGLL